MDTSKGIIPLIPWSLTKEINIESINNTLMGLPVGYRTRWQVEHFAPASQRIINPRELTFFDVNLKNVFHFGNIFVI